MKVLVTGASGFIGSYLVSILENSNYDVHATYHDNKPNEINKKTNWHQLDLFENIKVENLIQTIKPNHIIHLAWVTEHGKFWDSPLNKDWVDASINLFKKFKSIKGHKFISCGTKAEYFDGEFIDKHLNSTFECKEDMILNSDSIYGKSKNFLHEQLRVLDQEGSQSLVWARVFDTYGPYEDKRKFCSYVIDNAINNKKVECINPSLGMDFLHVYDIAKAFKIILDNDFIGTVNISSGKAVELRDIAKYVLKKFEKENLLHLNLASKDCRTMFGDNEILKSLGWSQKYDINKGLDDLIEFRIKNK
jgi:UDP-glucose 4-epimerase